jgi:hypothetical protein
MSVSGQRCLVRPVPFSPGTHFMPSNCKLCGVYEFRRTIVIGAGTRLSVAGESDSLFLTLCVLCSLGGKAGREACLDRPKGSSGSPGISSKRVSLNSNFFISVSSFLLPLQKKRTKEKEAGTEQSRT